MQEELETMASDCREKIGTIGQLEEVIREREDSEAILVKKNEHLETQIEKLKSTQVCQELSLFDFITKCKYMVCFLKF